MQTYAWKESCLPSVPIILANYHITGVYEASMREAAPLLGGGDGRVRGRRDVTVLTKAELRNKPLALTVKMVCNLQASFLSTCLLVPKDRLGAVNWLEMKGGRERTCSQISLSHLLSQNTWLKCQSKRLSLKSVIFLDREESNLLFSEYMSQLCLCVTKKQLCN